MTTNHKIQIIYDEETGTLTGTHSCVVEVGGYRIHHRRAVDLPESVAAAMEKVIDANRSEVEEEAKSGAVSHVAALRGRIPSGFKSLKVEGGAALFGGTEGN